MEAVKKKITSKCERKIKKKEPPESIRKWSPGGAKMREKKRKDLSKCKYNESLLRKQKDRAQYRASHDGATDKIINKKTHMNRLGGGTRGPCEGGAFAMNLLSRVFREDENTSNRRK